MTKYIFVSGGVISGIGKGITSASISLLLKLAGYIVAPIKFENYLNVDAGTINPIEHGDTFLCEDGTEGDMDLGTYEKFLGEAMGKDNFITMGKIYQTVIEKERRFEYNGEDVEAIPHITDEIIRLIKHVGEQKKADVVVVELGGTVGEYQNALYYEAARMLTLRSPQDVIHIHVGYVPTPDHLGEPKTKPTQLSVKSLNSMGIQPNLLIARAKKPLDQRRIERLATFCNLHPNDIINNPDVKHIYRLPLILEEQSTTTKILRKLGLPDKKPNLDEWKKLNIMLNHKTKKVKLAIVGKYFSTGDYKLKDAYAALYDAIEHASIYCATDIDIQVVDAQQIEEKGVHIIGNPDGIIVPIGWGIRGAEGKIAAASYARQNKVPYLGLCYGMQLATIAYARDVLGWTDANTTENVANTKHPVIHLIPTQAEVIAKRAYGGTMRLGGWDAIIKPGTQAYELYKRFNYYKMLNEQTQEMIVSERHRHRYEFNDFYAEELTQAGLIISARSVAEGLVEVIELPKSVHPFYLATQGHPEYKSKPLRPHPFFIGLVEAMSR